MWVGGKIMPDNDKTIFSYLNPTCNEMLSKVSSEDLEDLLLVLDRYYLEYRDSLGLSNNDTFGIEIEMEHFDLLGFSRVNYGIIYKELRELVGSNRWDSRNDITLVDGREIVSEILTDSNKNWENIRKVCEYSNTRAQIDINCSSHVHAGAQILGENTLYWYRFFRLWSIYENVIYRFCYGEYLTHRPNILEYARPCAGFYDTRLKLLDDRLNYRLIEMLNILEPKRMPDRYTKKMGVSYWRMLADDHYELYEDFNKLNDGCTVEFRAANGTFDFVIWQNLINFFIKMIVYCKSDKFDDDILNRRKIEVEGIFDKLEEYSQIYLDQAIELCDMIFDNNLDKIYFLRQYLKSFEVVDKPFTRAKKFTTTRM